jgi:GxxExxY protein
MTVHRVLGCGFLEKVYGNALGVELRDRGLELQRQVEFPVEYRGHSVGQYFADFVVENSLLLEVKAARTLIPEHESQLLNYLYASRIQTGLLFNFGSRSLQFKRLTIAPMNSRFGQLSSSM